MSLQSGAAAPSPGRTTERVRRPHALVGLLTANWRDFGLLGALVALCLVYAVLAPNFLTEFNLVNVIRQVSIVAIAAVGMTTIILIAGIDLSVGSAVALIGTVVALYLNGYADPGIAQAAIAVVIAVATGIAIGGLNGIVIAVLGVPAFIATLAALTAYRGFALLLTDSKPVSIPSGDFTAIGTGYIGPVPAPVVIMLATFGIGYLLLSRSKAGRRIYAIGGNQEAARLSGVRVNRIVILVYVFAGICVAIASVIATARLASGQPAGFVGFELDVIAAVVVGGTSLMGGRGRLSGTLLGALLIGVLANGLTLMDVQEYWQQIVTGLVIVAAIVLDNFVRRSSRKG
jgi:ribose transport system permease protein